MKQFRDVSVLTPMVYRMSFQAKSQFGVGQPLPQTAMAGAYSVELVCKTLKCIDIKYRF